MDRRTSCMLHLHWQNRFPNAEGIEREKVWKIVEMAESEKGKWNKLLIICINELYV